MTSARKYSIPIWVRVHCIYRSKMRFDTPRSAGRVLNRGCIINTIKSTWSLGQSAPFPRSPLLIKSVQQLTNFSRRGHRQQYPAILSDLNKNCRTRALLQLNFRDREGEVGEAPAESIERWYGRNLAFPFSASLIL